MKRVQFSVTDLKVELLRKGLTQRALAGESGISLATISAVCNGRRCSQETAERIAAAIPAPLESLLVKDPQ